jgi:uncharacterized radical SAM superfamily Fe-S cluster-containing enzyme
MILNTSFKDIDRKKLYHLPWSNTNNPGVWIEPTNKCNITCRDCYRENLGKHKAFSKVKKEIDVSIKKRNCDYITIAGGEPLLYPHLKKVIKYINSKNVFTVLLTNGIELTLEKIIKLKQIGLSKLIIHIDSGQNRPEWENKNEMELNKLREYYADLVYETGMNNFGLIMTVYSDTLQYIPSIILWTKKHVKKVKHIVFVCYRHPIHKIRSGNQKNEKEVKTLDVFNKIREVYPDLYPNSYLNGTVDKNSLKWLYSTIIFNEKEVIGYLDHKFIKYMTLKYFIKERKYPCLKRISKFNLFTSFFKSNLIKKIFLNHIKSIISNPSELSTTLFTQTLLIIQPPDILADGRIDMCNGCPDAILYKDEMVPSCRLEEYLKYGHLLKIKDVSS